METIAFDLETHLIEKGNITPRMVCLSNSKGEIFDRTDGIAWFSKHIGKVRLVGHNVFFDLGVLLREAPELTNRVFSALDKDLITDTMVRDKIIANEEGTLSIRRFSLAACVKARLGKHVEKEDTWRMRYAELDGIPIDEWPEDAKQYAINDSVVTKELYDRQGKVHEEYEQVRATWALYTCSIEGLRTDRDAVSKLKPRLESEYQKHKEVAKKAGFIREYGVHYCRETGAIVSGTHEELKALRKEKKITKTLKSQAGSRNLAAVRYEIKKYFLKPPMTNTGSISTAREVLESCGKDTPLYSLSEMGKIEKLLKTYVPVLEQGTKVPINPSYNSILETFRTSCRNPSVQVLPRVGGIRECFVPRSEHLYVFCDYDTLELRALAQILLDLGFKSVMAKVLKQGRDLHLALAADMLRIPYEEAQKRLENNDPEIEKMRQMSKVPNFGFPGGMGSAALVNYAKGMNINIKPKEAEALKKEYMSVWPEMRNYFNHCNSLVKNKNTTVDFIRSGYKRKGVTFTSTCNGFFQHLAAMGAKSALYKVVNECYTGYSKLRGCKPVLFLHDEIAIEAPEKKASNAAKRLQEVMVSEMSKWIPDIPITCEPVLLRRWYKGAKPLYIDGELVPVKPKKVDGKNKWVYDDINGK